MKGGRQGGRGRFCGTQRTEPKHNVERGEQTLMKRLSILLAVMALALTMAAGVAYAATITCDGGDCNGTTEDDTITGSVNRDEIDARAGDDFVNARAGFDRVFGQAGVDELYGGGNGDFVGGGPGRDTVVGGSGEDGMYGADGDDRIDAADGIRDRRVDGGPVFDVCIIDFQDRAVTEECERERLG